MKKNPQKVLFTAIALLMLNRRIARSRGEMWLPRGEKRKKRKPHNYKTPKTEN